ncbi:MAG: hypothetical protein ACSLE2_08840 [Lysobacterales bacterium]
MNSNPTNFLGRHRAFTRQAAALLCSTAVLLPVTVHAQDAAEGWQWRATIYAWLPDIDGKTQFPSGAGGPSIGVDAGQLIDNLDFTFMAALQARKGDWGMFTDLIYLDEGAGRSGSREFTVGRQELPADVTVDAVLDVKSWVWTLAGTYSLSGQSRNPVDLLFGARMLDLEQALDWSFNGDLSGLPLPGRSGSSTVSGTNWDAIVGLKGQAFFGADSRWVVPWHLDVGTGDSDLTWQAMAGVGYQFGWGAVVLNYRYMDYDMDSDAAVTDLNLSGPMLGASFAW